MPARPGPRRAAVPPGAAGASTGADAARTRRSAWAALVLLVGGLSLGVVLALVGGPWQVLAVLRMDSLAFALGMHVGGNFTGLLLDSLSREETLTGWSRFTTPSVIAMLAETLVTAAAVWYLGRPTRLSASHR